MRKVFKIAVLSLFGLTLPAANADEICHQGIYGQVYANCEN